MGINCVAITAFANLCVSAIEDQMRYALGVPDGVGDRYRTALRRTSSGNPFRLFAAATLQIANHGGKGQITGIQSTGCCRVIVSNERIVFRSEYQCRHTGHPLILKMRHPMRRAKNWCPLPGWRRQFYPVGLYNGVFVGAARAKYASGRPPLVDQPRARRSRRALSTDVSRSQLQCHLLIGRIHGLQGLGMGSSFRFTRSRSTSICRISDLVRSVRQNGRCQASKTGQRGSSRPSKRSDSAAQVSSLRW